MKKYTLNEITLMQYIFLNFGMVVSIGFLSLPRVLAEQAGTAGWIALLIVWVISLIASLIVIQVMKRYPDGTLLDLLTVYLGKWAGKAGAVLFALYLIYYGYTGLIYTVMITKQYLLQQTPAYLIMFLLLIPTYVVVRSGLRIVGRYVVLIMLLSVWIPFVYLLPLKDANWLRLFPVLKEGWEPVFAAVPGTFYYHIGFSTTFILYPFLRNKQKASTGIVISYTLTMLMYLFITVICFVYFSSDEIMTYNEPTINLLKTIEFKFIARIELLFIAFYLLIFSLSWIPTMYMSVFCTTWLIGKQDHRNHLRLLWLFIAVGSYFFMPTFFQSEKMNTLLGQIGFVVEYIVPVCLLLYVWIHDRLGWRKHL
ncbi:spore germination protein (amino acid permease) [Paenibacillus sp. V4I9]|uniref:GerAB/ArcD/ProY family transporter n=1 Tax=Paenibacillus sp. V4I9 TaxID=3042308 RepID=UPI002780BF8E|nr:endospore germination permease [Paenibacillus sp. V4I9]MDQ0887044.1 spore germination protein (amino acid permease) [Paenibacillus sp. V4I9]